MLTNNLDQLKDNVEKKIKELQKFQKNTSFTIKFPHATFNKKDNNIVKEDLFNLLLLLESSYDGIVMSDKSGRIFYATSGVERISGIKLSEIIGKTAQELEDEGAVISQSKKILGKNPLAIIQKVRTGVEVFITSIPVYDIDGDLVCYIANYRGMAELNKLKQELEETNLLYYAELRELRDRLMDINNIVVKSQKMKKIVQQIIKIAPTDATVLITGESGTGKEIIAKMIHRMSSRKKGPFVQINCGAIPENLLESELFGYEKGAFTGAHTQGKIGMLEMANKGTILLDEIGDLPLHLQVKLLKAVQDQEIYRIGSSKSIKLEVRIIAATNRDLQKMVKQGTFREDLFYRLNVIPLYIPPLRDRMEDIIPLTHHFLNKYNKKYDTDRIFSINVCNTFEKYLWPGNVRELENIVERLVIMSNEEVIDIDYLPPSMKEYCYCEKHSVNLIPLKKAREQVEKDLICKALRKYRTIRKAAVVLGVDHSTIARKVKKFKIEY